MCGLFDAFQVGSVSIKNTKNILIKNIGDASLGALCWWLFGYGVAFGEDKGNGFIGGSEFALKGSSYEICFSKYYSLACNGCVLCVLTKLGKKIEV